MTIRELQKEIAKLKAKQAQMEARLNELAPEPVTMDDINLQMHLKEMARRERAGDPSMRKEWNRRHKNADA